VRLIPSNLFWYVMHAMSVRVRFAPSPTGHLHIGGARTALFNWLYARRMGGRFILRIEDTDERRSSAEMVQGILDGLTWLGLDWDEGPYFQSQETARNRELADQLLVEGFAYRDFSPPGSGPESVAAYRELSSDQSDTRAASGEPFAVRFKVPQGRDLFFEDRVFGPIRVNTSAIADFVIVRSDRMPTYHLSVVADDIRMEISHVIRGADHLSNTAKHILLFEALGKPVPVFAHLPLILGPDKKRLSKRHGAASVTEYAARGYLPQAVRNYLALLGWSPGDDTELFEESDLISRFDLDGINKANAVFDISKLEWMNKRCISSLPVTDLLPAVRKHLEEQELWDDAFETGKKEWFVRLLDLLRMRAASLEDLVTSGRAFFTDDFEYEAKSLEKYSAAKDPSLRITLRTGLEELSAAFRDLQPFNEEKTETVLRAIAEKHALKTGLFIGAVRVALTGFGRAPGIFDVITILGRQKVLQRLARFLEVLQ